MNKQTEQIRNFLQTVYQSSDDATCAQVQAQLLDYVNTRINTYVNWNQSLQAFTEVRQHLDSCVNCSEAFAQIHETILATQSESQSLPTPDLGFLQPQLSLSERLNDAISQLGDRIRLQFSVDLLPALRPAMATGALRSAQNQPYGELLLQLDPPAELIERWNTTISVYRDHQSPILCMVEVTVAPPDRSWPDLAGIPVTLSIGTDERAQETDAFGVVSFERIAIEQLPAVAIAVQMM